MDLGIAGRTGIVTGASSGIGRATAEQFVDTVWQLTGAAPQKIDAPVVRGKAQPSATRRSRKRHS